MSKCEDISDILKYLQKNLTYKRFHHSLGVAYTASALAMCHGVNLKDAELAGLLHDCAKWMNNEESIKFCKQNSISISEIEKRNPYLLHGKIGCFIAANKFKIDNEDVLKAISNHTTGRPEMTSLEKIIFVADYIEPSRETLTNLPEIRKIAFKDLNGALIRILKDTLEYLSNRGGEMDPMTIKTYDYYRAE